MGSTAPTGVTEPQVRALSAVHQTALPLNTEKLRRAEAPLENRRIVKSKDTNLRLYATGDSSELSTPAQKAARRMEGHFFGFSSSFDGLGEGCEGGSSSSVGAVEVFEAGAAEEGPDAAEEGPGAV